MTGSRPGDERPAPPLVVLRALGLGDLLTAVPALRGLRRRFPGRRILLAGPPPPGGLLRRYGLVDGVIPTEGLQARPPGRRLSGHLAVNLHGRGPQSHRLLLAGEPAGLLAFAEPSIGVPGPVWRDDEHEVLRWCRLVATADLGPGSTGGRDGTGGSGGAQGSVRDGRARWGGCGPVDLVLPGARSPDRRTGPVVIHPGAASGARQWPPERFGEVAAALHRDGLPVVVTGSRGEAVLCRTVVARAGLPPAADLCDRLGLTALAGMLGRARLLICGDTGVAHLATALRTPSVLLFGPVPPHRWGPLVDVPRHRVLWHGAPDRTGDPHADRPDPVLLRITAAEVLDAARALLHPGDRPHPGDRRRSRSGGDPGLLPEPVDRHPQAVLPAGPGLPGEQVPGP